MPLAKRRRATTITAAVIAVPMLAGVAWLMLAPQRVEQRYPELVEAALAWAASTLGPWWGTIDGADFVANIAVFVPIGILAYLIVPRRAWLIALLLGPVIAAAIELAQRFLLPGRVSSPTDVVAAAIGSSAGVVIAVLCTLATARVPASRARAARPGAA
ncbi:MAG: VanZ family protein [Microbacterium sp.]|uniref:VanZ family protein n=1 Tax=Microbacterium sp. TaxID=51671 RepID=UPI0039E68C82